MSAPKKSGFTLVELLVVISIIAILSVISITVFTGVQNNARINATKEELRRLQQNLIRYKINNGELPPPGDNCPACNNDNVSRANDLRNNLLAVLASPLNGGPYIASIEEFVFDAWGIAYWYDDNDANIGPPPCQGGTPTNTSSIYSSGPDKNLGGGDDIIFNIPCP